MSIFVGCRGISQSCESVAVALKYSHHTLNFLAPKLPNLNIFKEIKFLVQIYLNVNIIVLLPEAAVLPC